MALTDTFFLIASADEAIHLRVLAKLSRLVQRDELMTSIREANDAQQIWALIRDCENELS